MQNIIISGTLEGAAINGNCCYTLLFKSNQNIVPNNKLFLHGCVLDNKDLVGSYYNTSDLVKRLNVDNFTVEII